MSAVLLRINEIGAVIDRPDSVFGALFSGRHPRRGGPFRVRACGVYVQSDRDLPPSNPQNTSLSRNGVLPSGPLRTVVESNSLHAIGNGSSLHTSNHLSKRIRDQAAVAQRKRHGAEVAHQF